MTLLTSCAAAIALSGCALTTAGVKKGDERNFARSLNDVNAGRAIKARMKRAEGFDVSGVNVEVAEGVVLLSGYADTPEDRIEAERIAWSAAEVLQVGNEISLGEKSGFIRGTKDAVLHQNVMARLIANKSTKARNFNVEVNDGKVYLLGVARTREELQEAAEIASRTKGAKEVVSYMTVAGESPSAGYANISPSAGAYPQAATQPYTQPHTQSYTAPSTGAIPYSPSSGGLSDYPADGLSAGRAMPAPAIPSVPLDAPVIKDPDAIESGEAYFVDPQTGQRIELPPGVEPIPYVPPTPGSLGAGAAPLPPGAKPSRVLGDGSSEMIAQTPSDITGVPAGQFPTDQQLGSYRTGVPGEAVSIIESAPYVIDPTTGEQIPVVFDNRGQAYLVK